MSQQIPQGRLIGFMVSSGEDENGNHVVSIEAILEVTPEELLANIFNSLIEESDAPPVAPKEDGDGLDDNFDVNFEEFMKDWLSLTEDDEEGEEPEEDLSFEDLEDVEDANFSFPIDEDEDFDFEVDDNDAEPKE